MNTARLRNNERKKEKWTALNAFNRQRSWKIEQNEKIQKK
jgi:hypothetical protein